MRAPKSHVGGNVRGAAVLVALLALGATLWFVLGADDSLDRISATARIRIGYAVEEPYAFVAVGGHVTGEAPEFARLIVGRMGIPEILWIQTDFDSLIPDLEAGRFDVVAAGMFITPERARRVRFSIPDVRVAPGLMVRKSNPLRLQSHQSVASHPEARVAVLAGSVEEAALRSLGMRPPRLTTLPDAGAALLALQGGNADALALSLPSIRWITMRFDAFEAIPITEHRAATGQTGFAFRRGDRALADAWSRAQASLAGGAAHRDIAVRFGFAPDDLVAALRTPGP